MTETQNTLVIIKPDYIDKTTSILQLLQYNGFRITHRKITYFSPEQAAEFYKELEKVDPCFALKVMSLSKGKSEAIILNKVNAIRDLLTIMTSPSCCQHLNSGLEYKIHASVSEANALNEIRYIFPNVIGNVSRKMHFGAFCGYSNMTGLFAEGIFDACESKTEDARGFLSQWLHAHSYQFESNAWCEQ